MTNEQVEQLKALVEAGKKATQEPWSEQFRGTSESGYQCCCVYPTCLQGESSWWTDDPAFVVAAANARPAIEAMLAENERLRKVVADGIDTIAMHQYPMGDSGVMVVNHTEAEQWVRRALTALKGTQ